MNKYLIVGVIAVLVIAGGWWYINQSSLPGVAPFSLSLPGGMNFDGYVAPLQSRNNIDPSDPSFTLMKTMHSTDSATDVLSFLSVQTSNTVKREACVLSGNAGPAKLDNLDAQRFESTMTCSSQSCVEDGPEYGYNESVWAVYAGNQCYRIHVVVSPEDSTKDRGQVRQVRDEKYSSLVKAVESIKFSR